MSQDMASGRAGSDPTDSSAPSKKSTPEGGAASPAVARDTTVSSREHHSADSGNGDGAGPNSDRNPGGRRRRRGSRGGSQRSADPSRSEQEQSNIEPDLPDRPNEGVPSPEAAARATVPRQRSTGSAGEPRIPRIGDTRPAPGGDAGEPAPARSGDRRSRRNTSTQSSPRSQASPANASAVTGDAGEPDGEGRRDPRRRRRGSSDGAARRGRQDQRSGGGRPDRAPTGTSAPPAQRDRNGRPLGRYLMCVHVLPKATQIAVLEGRSLIEHYVSRPTDSATQIHGNIYLGRVQNVLPGMEAAFVDIGTPKNAVLYRGDLQFDPNDVDAAIAGKAKANDVRIEQVLRNGQLVLCQVTKNPIGSKGARLTQDVSLPGRFVVLIPNSDTYGISKRLGDDERKRLRRILDDIRPAGHGLIVRTAAEGASADELRRDVAHLLAQWDRIDSKRSKAKGPTLLYKEPDLAVRVIREEFNRNYRGIVIDDRELYDEVRSYVESITPELADRVEYHDPASEALPLYERHRVHEQLHKALDRKVWLPSGGSLIIERTEALTVIDVNTGKNVGSSSLEETVFRNNLEAADEIARQLRLRDIGGIIVIDFIDMETRANRDAVVVAFREALSRDKTRSQVFDISELGLLEMTRKRISEGLVESLSSTCPDCGGRGFRLDEDLVGEGR